MLFGQRQKAIPQLWHRIQESGLSRWMRMLFRSKAYQ
jgi:hypothetical protein